MPFFTNLIHKISGKHVLTEEDRETGKEIRLLKAQYRKEELEREAEIKRLRDEKLIQKLSNGDQETAMIMSLFASAMNSPKPQQTTQIEEIKPVLIKLSDEDINKAFSQLPKVALKIGKSLSQDALRQFINQKIGLVDDDTFNRINNTLRRF